MNMKKYILPAVQTALLVSILTVLLIYEEIHFTCRTDGFAGKHFNGFTDFIQKRPCVKRATYLPMGG